MRNTMDAETIRRLIHANYTSLSYFASWLLHLSQFGFNSSHAVHSDDWLVDSGGKGWKFEFKHLKHYSESSMRCSCRFVRHPLAYCFCIPKYSWTVCLTHIFDYFRVSAIPINLWSSKTEFFWYSRSETSFGRTLHSSSSLLIWP